MVWRSRALKRTLCTRFVAVFSKDRATPFGTWVKRHLCAEIPGLREAGCDPDAPFDDRLRDALLQALFRAGSDIVIVPFQDLFGWRDRVNLPAVVNDENWTWRLPWPIDDLDTCPKRASAPHSSARWRRSVGARSYSELPTPNSQRKRHCHASVKCATTGYLSRLLP